MTSNLVWFHSEDTERYLRFWKTNVNQIYQQGRDNVPQYLKRLTDEGIISMPREKEEQLASKFYNTAIPNLNICPGFGIFYTLDSVEAEKLDKSGKLKFLLAEKVKEGLRVASLDAHQVLKNF